jgi:hypothetical protein
MFCVFAFLDGARPPAPFFDNRTTERYYPISAHILHTIQGMPNILGEIVESAEGVLTPRRVCAQGRGKITGEALND